MRSHDTKAVSFSHRTMIHEDNKEGRAWAGARRNGTAKIWREEAGDSCKWRAFLLANIFCISTLNLPHAKARWCCHYLCSYNHILVETIPVSVSWWPLAYWKKHETATKLLWLVESLPLLAFYLSCILSPVVVGLFPFWLPCRIGSPGSPASRTLRSAEFGFCASSQTRTSMKSQPKSLNRSSKFWCGLENMKPFCPSQFSSMSQKLSLVSRRVSPSHPKPSFFHQPSRFAKRNMPVTRPKRAGDLSQMVQSSN